MPATTLTDRALIRLSGEDVRGFLQGLVTSDVSGALPVWAGLLSAQGKCLFDFLVWADGDDLLVDCKAAAADELAKRLRMYRLRRPIEIARDGALAVHWAPDGDQGVPDPRLPALGRRWLAPADEAASGWLAHRLRHGVCEGRAELGDLLWLECNAAELNGVSFTKGCYVGQENTARMNWRQKVNRRLVVVAAAEPGPRTKAFYPELSLAVEHRRVDDLAGLPLPDWLAAAIA
ncbi:YgfZ/GcvT domain-containing protein [Sphingomonas astaxanthinifaciens]|uniref:Aminomethyltransferase n=1 Tax=Sphingomonas astaxanthinifaciens DSM 22298 TaxID=1123267 RepID=A0ABQ5Z583_9SPHN|nr:folate-binding protein YgfZ [Sphingomonas astaxanthinifaciens]GLR47888.1 aminomethyltransferase [Sphingomonas astaxanthinifaciens DSM 22298]